MTTQVFIPLNINLQYNIWDFEVLIVVLMKVQVWFDVIKCLLINRCILLRWAYCLHLQSYQDISRKWSLCYLNTDNIRGTGKKKCWPLSWLRIRNRVLSLILYLLSFKMVVFFQLSSRVTEPSQDSDTIHNLVSSSGLASWRWNTNFLLHHFILILSNQ